MAGSWIRGHAIDGLGAEPSGRRSTSRRPFAAAMWSAERRSKSVVRLSKVGRERRAAARRAVSPDCAAPKKSTSSLGRLQLAPCPIAACQVEGPGNLAADGTVLLGEQRGAWRAA